MSLTSYDETLAKNAQSNPPSLIPFPKIESILTSLLSSSTGVEAIFNSQRKAFIQSTTAAKEKGLSSSLPIQTAGQPPQPPMNRAGPGAQVCVKTGYTQNGHVMVTKVAAGGGYESGNTGVVFAFDTKTLRLKTILCDEGLLTEVRTAAACAYASKFILGKERIQKIQKVGIVGGGVQAVWQLRLLLAGKVIPDTCRTVVVKTRSKESANAFMESMKSSTYVFDHEWNFEHYESVANGGEGFTKCQLIHTLTPSRESVLEVEDITVPTSANSNFLHITAVGADSVGKQEIDPEIIRIAGNRSKEDGSGALICDSLSQTKERGEFQSSKEFWPVISEIGSIIEEREEKVEGKETSSSSLPILSIFDSSGLALQDVEFANLISSALVEE